MINYIVQVLLFQTIFLVVYDFILKKETFFQWNRAYLIVTSVLAYVIPLFKFTGASENIPPEYRIMLPEVMLSPETFIEKQVESSATLFSGMQWVFIIGIIIASLIFIYKLFQIFKLIHQNNKEVNHDYKLVIIPKQNAAFSFFHYIFLGKKVQQKEAIIKHELVHVKQKHSLDLLFFEIQKIVFWFNPYSFMYQNRISEVHEFIADSNAVHKKDKSSYFQNILAEVFQVEKFAFVNAFYKKSIIKKRIIMLTKNKSKEIFKFKYLLLIPVLMGMLVYLSCKTEVLEVQKELTKKGALIELMEEKVKDGSGSLEELKYIKNLNFSKSYNEDQRIFEKSGNLEKLLEGLLYGMKKKKEYLNSNPKVAAKDYSDADEVPFAVIDQAPIFPGCEDAEDQRACMVEKITEHVKLHFDTSLSENLGLEPGRKKVYVQFKIDKTGKIVGIKARGPHKDLEEEAIRVVTSLPQMIPGEENGKKVGVKYTLPITLNVE